MAFTLMSTSCVDCAEFSIFILGGTCTIWSLKNKVIGCIPEIWGLYWITDRPNSTSPHTHVANAAVKRITINELHQQMGHVNHEDLCHMVKKGMVTRISLDIVSTPDFCEACMKAKTTHKLFLKESKSEYQSRDLVVPVASPWLMRIWGTVFNSNIGHSSWS